jgi:dihydrodipicolinate synthase/N-acetylneuraminate lyase
MLARLVEQIEHVEYIKEETFPATHRITEALEQAGPKLKGVFGGAGGRHLLLEHPRGVAGQMPGCHVTDVVVRLWNALESGHRCEAKRVYGLLAPLFALETLKGTYYPEVLRRRQVIASSYSRHTVDAPTRDAHDDAALDEILRDLEPLFTWRDAPILYGHAAAEPPSADPPAAAAR